MRRSLTLSLFALVGVATAQTSLDPNEAPIVNALETMRKEPALAFQMTGTEKIGRTERTFRAVVSFRRSYDPRTGKESKGEVNLEVFENGSLTPSRRIVGDGVTLRNYDLARREVTATVYGFEGNTLPPNYANGNVKSDVPKMLSQLRAMTSGPEAQLSRFLSEMNPAGIEYASRYSSWMPGVRPKSFLEVTPTEAGGPRQTHSELTVDDVIPDPLTSYPYQNGTSQWTMYAVDRAGTNRDVVFQIDQKENPDTGEIKTTLGSLFYNERSSGGQRLVALTIVPVDATSFTSALFQPYTGTTAAQFRPVFGVRRSG